MSTTWKNGQPLSEKNDSSGGHIHFSGVFRLPKSDHQQERDIYWTVHDNHVYIPDLKNGTHHDWESAIDDYPNAAEIKLQLFNHILGQYRTQSSKPDGVFVAALTVTDSDKKDIYIAFNTNESNPYHKTCAEANVLDVVMAQLTNDQAKSKALYLMAGANPDGGIENGSMNDHAIMPCGKCSDVIRNRSTDDATVTTIPVNDGRSSIELNNHAASIDEVQTGEAWQFSVSRQLLKYSELELEGEGLKQQQSASKNLQMDNWRNRVLSERASNIDKLENTANSRIAEKALANAKHNKSIYALDLDNSLANINEFMVQEIADAYQNSADKGEHQPKKIRCAVIKFDDGTFSYAVEYKGEDHKTTVTAEETAAFSSEQKRAKVAEVYVMEYDEKAKDENHHTMNSSLKESLERLYKRCNTTKGFNIHYIPLNEGNLSTKQVTDISQTLHSSEVYPSAFGGVSGVG